MDRSTRFAQTYTIEMVQAHHGGTITYTPTGPKLSGIPCLNPQHPGDNNSRSAYIVTSKEGNLRAICETHKCPWRDTNDAIRQSLGIQTWDNQNQIQNHPQPRIVAAYNSPDQRPAITEHRFDWHPGDPPCWWTIDYKTTNARPCDNPRPHKHTYVSPAGTDTTGYPLLIHQPDLPHAELAKWVVYVEGAHKANAIASAGATAASNVGGANGIRRWDLNALTGQNVIVWPDHDYDWSDKANTYLGRIRSVHPTQLILAQPVGTPGSKADAANLSNDAIIAHLLNTVATAADIIQGPVIQAQSPNSPNIPAPTAATGSADRTICNATTTTAHMCARMIQDHEHHLVAVRPQDSGALHVDARLLFVTPSGRLSDSQSSIRDLLHQSADLYAVEINRSELKPNQLSLSHKAARAMREPETIYKIFKVLGGVIHELERTRQLPAGLTVCNREQLDADWTVLGAPNGVIDLHSGELMPAHLARLKLVTGSTTDDYEPNAQHPMIDQVLPLSPLDEMMQWYNRYLGWSITHHVNKDIVAMGSPHDAGKTTLLNADVRSMGSYVTKATADTFLKPRGYAANPSAHNDGKAKLDSPARRTFIEELASPFNTEMANELSGGGIDQDYRAVGEKRRPYVRVSHMVFVYNIKEGDQTLMPMDGTSVGDALERRLYAFPLPQIPQTSQNPAMLEVANDRLFRQAYVARMVQLAKACLTGPDHTPAPPPGCRTMQENKQMLSSQAKPAVERDFIPNIFVPRQDDEQPAADSHTAYQLYLEWRKDEGETGRPITKTEFTQKLKERLGTARRGKKNVQGKQRPFNTWYWDHLTLEEPQENSLSHFVGDFAIDPPLRNTLQDHPVRLPVQNERVRKTDVTAYVEDDFSCQSLSANAIIEQTDENSHHVTHDSSCQSLSANAIIEQTSEAAPPAEPGPAPCRGCLQKELPRAADPFAPICPDCHYQGELDDGCPAAECLECHPTSADQSPDDQTELTQAAD